MEGDHRLVVVVVVDVLPDVDPLEVPTSDTREGRRATERLVGVVEAEVVTLSMCAHVMPEDDDVVAGVLDAAFAHSSRTVGSAHGSEA